jgi:hypothetical protein
MVLKQYCQENGHLMMTAAETTVLMHGVLTQQYIVCPRSYLGNILDYLEWYLMSVNNGINQDGTRAQIAISSSFLNCLLALT